MVSLDSEGEGGGDIVLCKYIIMYKNTLTIYVYLQNETALLY